MHMLGTDTSLLEESFSMDMLPTEFGGLAGNYNTIDWTDTMMLSSD